MVGLAPVPLTAHLQPQGAAVTAVLGIDTGSVYLANTAHLALVVLIIIQDPSGKKSRQSVRTEREWWSDHASYYVGT